MPTTEIFVVPQKHFVAPDRSYWMDESSKYCRYIGVFYDYTLNFDDLLYWDSSVDLNNNTITNVLHKLSVAILKLGREGIKPIIPGPDWECGNYWRWGHREQPGGGRTVNLPDSERKQVLLLHLINMYNKLIKMNKKNKLLYCYVHRGWGYER
jgi:hypothetical protein